MGEVLFVGFKRTDPASPRHFPRFFGGVVEGCGGRAAKFKEK
jgi:hypothetical protein